VRVDKRRYEVSRRPPFRVCDPRRPQDRIGAVPRSATRSSATAQVSRTWAVPAAETVAHLRRRCPSRSSRLARPSSRWNGL